MVRGGAETVRQSFPDFSDSLEALPRGPGPGRATQEVSENPHSLGHVGSPAAILRSPRHRCCAGLFLAWELRRCLLKYRHSRTRRTTHLSFPRPPMPKSRGSGGWSTRPASRPAETGEGSGHWIGRGSGVVSHLFQRCAGEYVATDAGFDAWPRCGRRSCNQCCGVDDRRRCRVVGTWR